MTVEEDLFLLTFLKKARNFAGHTVQLFIEERPLKQTSQMWNQF